jgi:16S rRNA (guanine(966)-N(2))-methyltransferase RsmD
LGTLRVISGSARGFRLHDVPGDVTRPITDRVKESLFNILGMDVAESTWWDVFGGTGAVGIEALSRGANFVRFTDNNRDAIEAINFNLTHTKLNEKARVIRCNAFQMLKQAVDRSFDYIYIAPPQYKNLWLDALNMVDEHSEWLAEDGWVIVQIHPVEYQPVKLTHFIEIEQRKYGSTLLVFFEWKVEEENA